MGNSQSPSMDQLNISTSTLSMCWLLRFPMDLLHRHKRSSIVWLMRSLYCVTTFGCSKSWFTTRRRVSQCSPSLQRAKNKRLKISWKKPADHCVVVFEIQAAWLIHLRRPTRATWSVRRLSFSLLYLHASESPNSGKKHTPLFSKNRSWNARQSCENKYTCCEFNVTDSDRHRNSGKNKNGQNIAKLISETIHKKRKYILIN